MHFNDLHSNHNDRSIRWLIYLWILVLICLFFVKCTPQQIRHLKLASYTASECALNASLACASQSAISCGQAQMGADWEAYANCLADESGPCVTSGLAKCGAASIVRLTGALIGGSSGCDKQKARQSVGSCLKDNPPSTHREAVLNVASCYVDACKED